MVDPKKDAEKSVDEVFDAEPVELGADVPETGQADQSINDLIGEQNREAEEFAKSFLKTVLRLRGVRIEREQFLRSELHKRGIAREVIDEAIATSPAAAGIDVVLLDDMANAAIAFETRKSSALSFAAGLPGGFGLLATVPGDVTQFYVHAFRVMQKTAYVYGWQSFLEDSKEVDDETLGKLSMFLGVMLGVGGASSSLTVFAASVARPAIQKAGRRQGADENHVVPGDEVDATGHRREADEGQPGEDRHEGRSRGRRRHFRRHDLRDAAGTIQEAHGASPRAAAAQRRRRRVASIGDARRRRGSVAR